MTRNDKEKSILLNFKLCKPILHLNHSIWKLVLTFTWIIFVRPIWIFIQLIIRNCVWFCGTLKLKNTHWETHARKFHSLLITLEREEANIQQNSICICPPKIDQMYAKEEWMKDCYFPQKKNRLVFLPAFTPLCPELLVVSCFEKRT
jgi:hypothetical protein